MNISGAREIHLNDLAETTPSTNSSEAWLGASSYWKPAHITVSAWLGHAPFAFWLVDALRPRSIVELGTHFGFSYFVFCEAAVRLGLDTRAFALDTWKGDDQAGIYGEEVFDSVQAINNAQYSSFSTLLRGYFDDSLAAIPDGSVDLLHIDGRHGLDDVTHDFEAWLPKLSNRGVVILHDIAEHQEGFGVWQFWETVTSRYPSFEFNHSHGLGVVGVGSDLPESMQAFFDAGKKTPARMRAAYERLGRDVEQLAAMYERAQHMVTLTAQLAEIRKATDQLTGRLHSARAELVGLHQQLEALRSSTSWRLTRPLRAIRFKLRRSVHPLE